MVKKLSEPYLPRGHSPKIDKMWRTWDLIKMSENLPADKWGKWVHDAIEESFKEWR